MYTMAKNTTISVSVETRERLKELGSMGDTMDDVIQDLIEKAYPQRLPDNTPI